MLPEIAKVKGIHPGAILKRELKARGMKSNELAKQVDEHTQTISAILNERRGINPGLSIRLGQQLGIDIEYFMYLQSSYDVQKKNDQLNRSKNTPNLKNIRKVLFWDTDFNQIDWERNKSAIIKRIFERGNDKEISEIIAFYGLPTIKRVIRLAKNDFLPAFTANVERYLGLKN